MPKMKGVNPYDTQLTENDFENDVHHGAVGGLWEEMGNLQFNFLKQQGLQPHHRLLDIGCGCLRGGIHFIEFQDKGQYYGLDVNTSLIEAGHYELEKANLVDKSPNLLVDSEFNFSRFDTQFDYMLAVSVLTHLSFNLTIRCFVNAAKVLAPNGKLYVTYFVAPTSGHIESFRQQPGNVMTNYDSDPYHFSNDELRWMASLAGLKVDIIGDWQHPRNQQMAVLSKA